MKISCQSCHSKYNVADEKIQGKIVKIRCRKCGATIVVNASGGAAANGSVPLPAATSPTGVAEGGGGEWHVSVSDSDQRTMTLGELVNAYNTGVVAQDTFIWTEGMADWKPLSEVDAVVTALHAAVEQGPVAAAVGEYRYGATAPVAAAPAYEPAAPAADYGRAPAFGGAFAVQTHPAPEPKRAAVVKREARARDLFATRSGEELHMDAPAGDGLAPTAGDDSRLTGQRNENSVLFSLDHLTKNAEKPSPQDQRTARTKDDSGLIDLKALAAKAESMRPPTMHDMNVGPQLGLAPALGFVSPLGGPLGGHHQETTPRSKVPLLVGAAAGIALLLVLGIVIGLKIGGGATPSGMATASATPFPPLPSATAEATATASANAIAQASATASAPVAPKPHAYAGGGGGAGPKPGGGPKPPQPGGGSGPVGASTSAGGTAGGGAAGGAGTAAAAGGGAAPSKKGDCGCNGDLMCMMKCSTH